MAYKITLRPGHPKKAFHRDGRTFVEGEPVVVEKLTPRLRGEKDKPEPWLLFEEIPDPPADDEGAEEEQQGPSEAAVAEDLTALTREQLLERVEAAGLKAPAGAKKADLIALLEGDGA